MSVTAAVVIGALAVAVAVSFLTAARRLAHPKWTAPLPGTPGHDRWFWGEHHWGDPGEPGEDAPSCFGCGRYLCDGTWPDCPVYKLLDQESAS